MGFISFVLCAFLLSPVINFDERFMINYAFYVFEVSVLIWIGWALQEF